MPVAAMMLSGTAAGGGGGGTPYYRTLTVDHTKIGSSDPTDFPVLVDITDVTLKSVSNGGHVTRTDGFDIFFTTTSSGSTQIPFERELYDPATGHFLAWVKASTLSHTSDTLFAYLRYGDGTTTTDQANPTAVWDTNFKGVYHLSDGTTLSGTDSTSNANNGTPGGTPLPSAVAGQIDGGASFAGNTSQLIDITDVASLRPLDHFSLSCWVKPTSFAGANGMMIAKGNTSTRAYEMDLAQTSGKIRLFFTQGANNFIGFTATTALTTGTWFHCAGTYDGTTMRVFLNAVADGTHAATGNCDTASGVSGNVGLGRLGGSNAEPLNGVLDECRISIGVARSVDWFLAEYNNGNSPSTFVSVGAETPV